jgi:alpha-D-ribose 1-methylphosphonate 5-triphosphate synthase subunit PhnH
MTASAYALTDQAFDAHRAFRGLLEAMSRPGKIISVGGQVSFPTVLQPSTAAIALSLFDHDTEIWMGDGIAGIEVYDFLKFNCGCPMTKSSLTADFAIVCAENDLPSVTQFKQGSDAFPDRSTTLIVQAPDLVTGPPITLTGPGIEHESVLTVAGIADYFWQERREQNSVFPRGVDIVFTSGDRVVALPRSTRLGD